MKRKFNIIGKSKYGTEIVDTAEGLYEARRLAKEYQLAFGNEWRVHYELNKNTK